MKTIIDRIRELQAYEGLTNQEFAEQLEISPAALSHIYSGRNKPSLTILEAIALRFPNVNLNYLLKGNGELFESMNDVNTVNKLESNAINLDKSPLIEKTITTKSSEREETSMNSEDDSTSEFPNVNTNFSQIVKVALFTRKGEVFFFTPTSDNPFL